MFKEKSSKKRLPLTESCKELTLDARHQRTLDEISDKRKLVHKLRQKHDASQQALNLVNLTIDGMKANQVDLDDTEYNLAWTNHLYYKDQLRTLEREISRLESCEDEISYFENTAAVLFSYYDLLKNQDTAETTVAHITAIEKPTKGRKKHLPIHTRSILEALNITQPASEMKANPPLDAAIDKRALVERYMVITDPTFVKMDKNDHSLGSCSKCNIPLLCMMQDGIMVCAGCGYQELMLVEQNKPIYRQPTKEASHFSYKRINHFNEWLSQIQGKESTDIPEEIFEKIVGEIKKEKIHDSSKLTYSKMREILKKLKINKYYEHIHYIISRINGMPTPNFAPELEDKLRTMFKEIQGPFLKHCPKDRKNFLSYSYVLYKFFQLLERDEYLKHFPLLKSREKLHLQDQIWRNICDELNWQFVESI
jgi:uncharacterized Zn finger protein (UPF0148 family)